MASVPEGVALYAYATEVLPPIDAIFALGGDKIETWLHAAVWERDIPYNSNFKGQSVVEAYERI